MVIDQICSSFKAAWSVSGGTVPAGRVWYDRAQQPNGLSGFPYLCFRVTADAPEIVTQVQGIKQPRIGSYTLELEFYTAQGMTGTTGDQITDQGNLMRAAESVLANIPATQPWYNVTKFLGCWQQGTVLQKNEELFNGKDVYVGQMEFLIKVEE